MALVVQNFLGEFFCQNPFLAFLRLKKEEEKFPMNTKLEG